MGGHDGSPAIHGVSFILGWQNLPMECNNCTKRSTTAGLGVVKDGRVDFEALIQFLALPTHVLLGL